ncbi:MAG TPA: PepSY-like domain-containing protein [Tepidisphaeraceae bacterium]|nr:PepSY-like domain-containing protein [Tepidisphaeraceae bacterium]
MKNSKLFLAAAIAVGSFAFTPAAFAKDSPKGGAAADAEVQVRYATLPAAVKESLDKERGAREVKSIYRVERDGRVFYRATIDSKGSDTQVRFAEDGKVLSEARTADESTPAARPRETAPAARPAADRRGTAVDYDRLPGAVRSGIARAAGSGTVKSVERLGSGANTTYRAEVGNKERDWAVTVDEDGKLVNRAEDSDNSKIVASYDSLPGKVKAAVTREAGAAKVGTVMQISRDKDTYYRVQILEGRGDGRWITVNDDGKPVDYTPR